MCSQYQIPILVDDIDDSFNKCFSAWPERYFIVHNGVMEEACEPTTEFGYDRLGLRRKLRKYVNIEANDPCVDLLASGHVVFSDTLYDFSGEGVELGADRPV